MSRMHSNRRGSSGSNKPYVTTPPDWSLTDKGEIERLIIDLHEKGNDSAAIGRILRDQYAVPSVRLVMGERVSSILQRLGASGRFPDDLTHLMRKAVRLSEHLKLNRRDIHNRRQLELTEAKIRRMVRYLKNHDRIEKDFKYRRDTVRLQLT